jgi:hypothetical protein
MCGAAAYRVLVQWCCVGPCLFGPGRVGLGTMLLNWVYLSPNGALEFVLFCGRLAVSQYNFLFIHSFNQPKPLWVWHPSPLVTDRSREAVCSSFSGSIPRTTDVAYTMSAPKRQWVQSRAALAATALWLP